MFLPTQGPFVNRHLREGFPALRLTYLWIPRPLVVPVLLPASERQVLHPVQCLLHRHSRRHCLHGHIQLLHKNDTLHCCSQNAHFPAL